MKITSVDIIKCREQSFSDQTPVFCRVNTDEGIYGYGEAGVSIAHYSLGCYELIKLMAKRLIGENPLDTDVIYQKLSGSSWAMGNGGVIYGAISAIDTALWDIKGKYLGVPLYVLLGGKHRNKLRSYASQLQKGWKNKETFANAPGDLGFLREACEAALADGYDAVKVDCICNKLDGTRNSRLDMMTYIPLGFQEDIVSRIETVRGAVGPHVDIIVENHNFTSANTAIQLGKLLEPYNIMFLEEPCNPLSTAEYERMAAHMSIPLATGERSYTCWGFLPLLETGSLAVIQPDLGNCGGVTEGRKICDLANVFGVSVQTHTCNSPISVALSLHMEAAIPNFIIHEHHTVNTIKENCELCIYDYQPVDGYFSVPELPGIGNELSQKALSDATIVTVKG
jgi:L-alanine-DL-glutamate epimerase-like enolase superfamily enzyme